MKYEKLSDYAERMGVKYQTAWLWFRDGKIENAIKQNGTIFVPLPQEEETTRDPLIAATYARVSSTQNKKSLETQNQRLYDYSTARGYTITSQVKEIGSGVTIKERNSLTYSMTIPGLSSSSNIKIDSLYSVTIT